MNYNYLHILFLACHKFILKNLFCGYCIIFLIGIPGMSKAQLWQGNLGLPIVNITFGSGASKPLLNNITKYPYTKGCPSAGQYSIEHFLFGCATGTWIMLTGDHTGDHDGNYMLVNGATAKGTVLIDTITGLCGNTTYQFSAFISNCLKDIACDGTPVLTNLTLSIETVSGKILTSYTTGDIATTDSKTWIEYGTYCTTPPAPIPLVVRITNNSGGACGSVFIMDDITFKAAGPAINVTINNSNNLVLDLCKGYTDVYNLHATYSSGYVDPVFQWQYSADTGKTWKYIPGAISLDYTIPHRNDSVFLFHLGISERSNAGNAKCSIFSDRIWTNVHSLPAVTPIQKVLGCLGKDLVLKTPPEFSTYLWTKPNGVQSKEQWLKLPGIQYKDAGLYSVKLTADFGCFIQDSFQVNISPSTSISTQTIYNICNGINVPLLATGDGNFTWTPNIYLSDTAIGNPIANPKDSVQYKVVLTNSYGCKDSAWVNINVFKNPVVSAGNDKIILLGDSTVLDGTVQGTSVEFYWAPITPLSNSSLLSPYVAPIVDTKYTLYASSTVGCGTVSAAVTIKVFKDVFMPTAFTPNGDGKNDIYHPPNLAGFKLISFTIFNRYGSKVFFTTNASVGWDGTANGEPQETGEYAYYLEMKHPSGKIINKKGSILLLR